MSKFWHFLTAWLVAGPLWVGLPAASAHAATYTVTVTTDTLDGTCNAHGSVREAIAAANLNPGADTSFCPPVSTP